MPTGKLLVRVKRTHLFLSVFFSPLLLMFIITGWWQTLPLHEEKLRFKGQTGTHASPNFFQTVMRKISEVHTDDTLPHHHSSMGFKILVVVMCVALIVSICLGLALAWQAMKNKVFVLGAFILGILVPVLMLYFA
jgi:hypothetical protein